MKKIAVIGSGFFGCTIALFLSKKYQVEIFEKEKNILKGVSSSNQQRFHLGYHYPRSPETVQEIRKSKKDFINFYGSSVLGNTKNYYGVSKNKSKTSYEKYLLFLEKNNLKYNISKIKIFSDLVSDALETQEKNLNFFQMKKKIKNLLKKNKIKINLAKMLTKNNIKNFDKIIIAAYDQNNSVLNQLGMKKFKYEKFKYELIEKTVIRLPKLYNKKSYIVVDGQFGCVDPYLGTKFHLMSDNVLSKIEVCEGHVPNFKNYKKKFVNKGIVKNIKYSNFYKIRYRLSKIMPFLKYSEYVGSLFAIRTVKLHVESTDDRRASYKKINNKIITVLAGKWIGCVSIAKQLLRKIDV